MTEWSNAHDAGDCLSSCSHPDHAFEGDAVELDWLIRRLQVGSSEAFDVEVQRARHEQTRPVLL